MNWVSVVLDLVRSGLGIWESKEKHKYIDRFLKLEKSLYEEEARDAKERDQAVIDNLHFDLMLFSRAFGSEIRGQNLIDKS